SCVLSRLRRTPHSTVFPYTTLFRSVSPLPSAEVKLSTSLMPARPPLNQAIDAVAAAAAAAPTARVNFSVQACSTSSATAYGSSRSEEHTSELQSRENLVCRLLLDKK